jgi:pimeloyl-ACP methyl ester carboxylesterase
MDETMERIRSGRGEVLLSDLETRERIMRTLMPLYWCTPEDARGQSHLHRPGHRIASQNFEVYEALVGRPFGELNGDLASSDVETRLSRVTAPVLIIQGGCDGVVPEGHADWLVKNLPDARKVFIAESGHSPFVDQTDIFVDKVREFLLE